MISFKPGEHEVDVFVVVFTAVVVGARVSQRKCWRCVAGVNIERPEMIIVMMMIFMTIMMTIVLMIMMTMAITFQLDKASSDEQCLK